MNILFSGSDERTFARFSEFLVREGHELHAFTGLLPPPSLLERADLAFVQAEGDTPFATAEQLKKIRSALPVIVLLPSREPGEIARAVQSGADEILAQPIVEGELLLKVRTVERVRGHAAALEKLAGAHAAYLKEVVKKTVAQNREIALRLLAAAEYKDDGTGKHIVRVAKYSRIIAEQLGVKGEFLDMMESAAPMHDIGKIAVPDRMLLKPGRLSAEETEIMRSHTVIGASILAGSDFPLLTMASEIALTHHERWDGSGYPHGVKGEKIPLPGRIVALADVFDALTSVRPYKAAFSWDKSVIIVREYRGRYFDPRVVDAFLNRILALESVFRENPDTDGARPAEDSESLDRIR